MWWYNFMEVLVPILTLLGMGYAVYRGLRWMLKVGQVHAPKNQPLSPSDLKVLEESAARLMADLRTTTDECVARIERALSQADAGIEAIAPPARISREVEVIAQGIPAEGDMMTGEVELVNALRAIAPRK